MPLDATPFAVEFYRDPSGEKPVATWLKEVRASNPDLARRCQAALRRLTYEPSFHRPPHVQAIGEGLLELRILGTDGARLLFFYASERRVIVVHAFAKKTQQIPDGERNRARRAMERWRQHQQPRRTSGSSDQ